MTVFYAGKDVTDTSQSATEKIVIEDSTEYMTIIVNKKTVGEVVEDTQTNSETFESHNEENKKEDEEISGE